jgi:hypothetical protein
MQTCSVYFLIGSTCLEGQEPKLSRTYRKAADDMGLMAIKNERLAGVSDDAYRAQASMATSAMMKAIGGNCTNIAVLRQRYSVFCQQLRQDADPRLRAWIDCIRTRKQSCGGPGLPE